MSIAALATGILEFWFGPAPHAARDVWFRKDPAFDAQIANRFGALVEAALRGEYREWTATPNGTLARVIVLDQFTRNIFRDTPRAFAGDEQALAMASAAVDAGQDGALDHYERWFV